MKESDMGIRVNRLDTVAVDVAQLIFHFASFAAHVAVFLLALMEQNKIDTEVEHNGWIALISVLMGVDTVVFIMSYLVWKADHDVTGKLPLINPVKEHFFLLVRNPATLTWVMTAVLFSLMMFQHYNFPASYRSYFNAQRFMTTPPLPSTTSPDLEDGQYTLYALRWLNILSLIVTWMPVRALLFTTQQHYHRFRPPKVGGYTLVSQVDR
jgi:hypothetical protein